jgi:hypothetical protein
MKVYTWSNKAIKKFRNKIKSSERMIFIEKKSAILYDSITLTIIEPFFYKSIDSHTIKTNEEVPDLYYSRKICTSKDDLYNDKEINIFIEKCKILNINIEVGNNAKICTCYPIGKCKTGLPVVFCSGAV